MKKMSFVALVFLSLANSNSAGPVGWGLKGGLNMANLVYSFSSSVTNITNDVIFGFTGGVFVDMGLTDFLSLRPEANFTMKGYQENDHHLGVVDQYGNFKGYIDGSFTFSYNYLEIPLLFKIHTSLGPQVEGNLLAGPSMAFLLNANDHYSTTSVGDAPINGNSLDLGFIFGTGIELDHVLLDIRCDLGLDSVSVFPRGPRNSVLSFQLGYRIQ